MRVMSPDHLVLTARSAEAKCACYAGVTGMEVAILRGLRQFRRGDFGLLPGECFQKGDQVRHLR
jgi:hypothetical protein